MQESIETLRTELEGRLRLETLLAETSARFVNLPSDQIDSEMLQHIQADEWRAILSGARAEAEKKAPKK